MEHAITLELQQSIVDQSRLWMEEIYINVDHFVTTGKILFQRSRWEESPEVQMPVPASKSEEFNLVQYGGVSVKLGDGRRNVEQFSGVDFNGELFDTLQNVLFQDYFQCVPLVGFDVDFQIVDSFLKNVNRLKTTRSIRRKMNER